MSWLRKQLKPQLIFIWIRSFWQEGSPRNQALRQKVAEKAPDRRLIFPSPVLCTTDNAAMIGFVALHKYAMGNFVQLDLNAKATAPLSFQPASGCEIWG